jgi:hypothetical protein
MTILATVMPSAGVRRPRMSRFGGSATRVLRQGPVERTRLRARARARLRRVGQSPRRTHPRVPPRSMRTGFAHRTRLVREPPRNSGSFIPIPDPVTGLLTRSFVPPPDDETLPGYLELCGGARPAGRGCCAGGTQDQERAGGLVRRPDLLRPALGLRAAGGAADSHIGGALVRRVPRHGARPVRGRVDGGAAADPDSAP